MTKSIEIKNDQKFQLNHEKICFKIDTILEKLWYTLRSSEDSTAYLKLYVSNKFAIDTITLEK